MHAPDPTAASLTASPADTIDALESGIVVRWWQTSAFLEVAGPDAASFLDGLCTQAVERIAVGTGVLGLFLDAKAHIVAPAVLHRTRDAAWTNPRTTESEDAAPRILVETLPELVEPLRAHLARYRLRAKATLEPTEVSTIALVGEGLDAGSAGDEWSIVAGQAHPTHVLLATSAACADAVRTATTEDGAVLAAPDAFEADRIERGIASLHDLLPGRMPAEVGGMDAAVALDAGCYLGQEPVARLHYRGRSNRTLRRIAALGDLHPPAPDPEDPDAHLALRRADAEPGARPVGQLTTWATSADGRVIALAMVRREVQAGEQLVLASDPDGSLLEPLDAAPE